MTSVIIRILLRYIAALLVARGFLSPESSDFASDPDVVEVVQIALGAGIGIIVEAWYYLARRFGWEA